MKGTEINKQTEKKRQKKEQKKKLNAHGSSPP
jgi:hypothetical protein